MNQKMALEIVHNFFSNVKITLAESEEEAQYQDQADDDQYEEFDPSTLDPFADAARINEIALKIES